MSLSHFQAGPYHFQTDEFVSTLFETSNNIADKTTLDSIGFDGEEGALLVGSWNAVDGDGIAVYGRVVLGGNDGSGGGNKGEAREFGGNWGGRRASGNRLFFMEFS